MKKILFCATVDYHFKAFHLPYMKWFKEQGWEVHVAAAGELNLPYTDVKVNLPIQRSPFSWQNFFAYQELKAMIKEQQYDLIHCHTPMGGVLARLAARNERKKSFTKVIYTAHGFHFCKGAPIMNWLIYYPIERFLSKYTDSLITINNEDYLLATTHKFKAATIEQVHGVGVDTERYKPVTTIQKQALREKYHYPNDAFLMFYAAEFNKNKNQQLLIRALSLIKKEVPQAKLLFAGEGSLLESCKELAVKLGVHDMVDFLGFRNDIDHWLQMSDLAVASSLREGLPVNIMEAMSCGLPVVATKNRGHSELVNHDQNGWIMDQDPQKFAKKMIVLAKNRPLRIRMGEESIKLVLDRYSLTHILQTKKKLYTKWISGSEEMKWSAQ